MHVAAAAAKGEALPCGADGGTHQRITLRVDLVHAPGCKQTQPVPSFSQTKRVLTACLGGG